MTSSSSGGYVTYRRPGSTVSGDIINTSTRIDNTVEASDPVADSQMKKLRYKQTAQFKDEERALDHRQRYWTLDYLRSAANDAIRKYNLFWDETLQMEGYDAIRARVGKEMRGEQQSESEEEAKA
jgi:hypothetical protein